jgi:hypothetical protein
MTPCYLRPPWLQRSVANRLVPPFRPSLIAKLLVCGRKSGRWRTVPLVLLERGSERYLVSYRRLAAYEQADGTMPTVAAAVRALPEPADHPIFRISASHRQGGWASE